MTNLKNTLPVYLFERGSSMDKQTDFELCELKQNINDNLLDLYVIIYNDIGDKEAKPYFDKIEKEFNRLFNYLDGRMELK